MRTLVHDLIKILQEYPPDAEVSGNHPTIDLYIKEHGKHTDFLCHLCTPRKYKKKSEDEVRALVEVEKEQETDGCVT